MKLFSKKPEGETLSSLNEEEIQKRLYGRYHRPDAAKATNSKQGTAVLATHSLQSQPHLVTPTKPTHQVSAAYNKKWVQVLSFLKNFQWKFFGIVAGAVFLAILLFQLVPGRIVRKEVHVLMPQSPNLSQERRTALEQNVQQAEQTVPQPVVTQATQSETHTARTPLRKYYAVQVCTYQREEDARKLRTQLEALNFAAFYQKSHSSQTGIAYYIVFLSKEDSYAQANVKLSQFRKTGVFKKFSDAFIRSV